MSNPLQAALSDQAAEDAVQPSVEPTPAEPPSPPDEPPRGPDGRFMARTTDAPLDPSVAQPPATAADPAPDAGPRPSEGAKVPLAALREEREQRQAAQRALKDLQGRMAGDQAAQPAPRPTTPEQQFAADHYAMNLRISRKFAAKEYGEDYVQAVHDWALARCETDPFFNAQIRASDDPYEEAVQAFRREEILSQVSTADLEAFNAWKAATAQQATQPTPATPANPPRSLVTAPGNGPTSGPVNTGDGEAFRAAIG